MTFTLLFLGFAALSGSITLILIVACALDARLTANDRKAQDAFLNNPFRTNLSFRTFPNIIREPDVLLYSSDEKTILSRGYFN
jgi:hypothetical protein